MAEDDVADSYLQRVGERLRAVRKQRRLSLQAVEASSQLEFKASVLGAYERGERAISVPRLQRLASFYEVPVDELLPKQVSAEAAAQLADETEPTVDLVTEGHEGAGARGGGDARVSIDLDRLRSGGGTDQHDLIARFVGMIQSQRREASRVITIRDDDVRTLANLLQTSPENMRRRLDDLGLRLHV